MIKKIIVDEDGMELQFSKANSKELLACISTPQQDNDEINYISLNKEDIKNLQKILSEYEQELD